MSFSDKRTNEAIDDMSEAEAKKLLKEMAKDLQRARSGSMYTLNKYMLNRFKMRQGQKLDPQLPNP